MSDENKLTKFEPAPMESAQAPAPAEMMQAMIKSGITQENVAAFTELVKLSERMEDRNAAKEFNRAYIAMQREMPSVQPLKPVPDKNGGVKYMYAPYEEIFAAVQPVMLKNGFAVKFSQKSEGGKATMFCTLIHEGGHSVTNEFTATVGQGPPGATASQADGSAATYAQRFAFCDALNIQIRKDNDGRAIGAPITAAQAKTLRERVHATGKDEAAFLKFAGAATFEEIKSANYDILDKTIRKAEKTA